MIEYEVIQWIIEKQIGHHVISFGRTDSGAEWISIDNRTTKKNSVIMPAYQFEEMYKFLFFPKG